MEHVMLDLETMGTASDAAIVAIGAVFFDPMTQSLGPEFYHTVDLKSSVEEGGKIDPETVMWWLKQEEAARQALMTGVDHIRSVLGYFQEYTLRECNRNDVKMWGNGSDFDNVVLGNAYRRTGIALPWSFRNNRCYRTALAGHPLESVQRVGTWHNALDDAKTQAVHLMKVMGNRGWR